MMMEVEFNLLREIRDLLRAQTELLQQLASPLVVTHGDQIPGLVGNRPGGIRWLPTDDGEPETPMSTGHTCEPTCGTTDGGSVNERCPWGCVAGFCDGYCLAARPRA